MLTELRPKRELLNPNFNGYKLSLDAIPVYRQAVSEGVDDVGQSEDQYSFIHTKVFSLHNHLFRDPWHDNNVYFVDNTWNVLKACLSSETNRVESLQTVWKIPHLAQRQPGHFNVSVEFPGPEVAVLADGCGHVYVLSRSSHSQWQPRGSSEVDTESGSVLMSARLADSALHCVLMSLQPSAEAQDPDSPASTRTDKPRPTTINTLLTWLTLETDDEGVWSVSCTRTLQGAGSVDYAALEVSCSALYVISNTKFVFTYDSANPLPPPEEKTTADITPGSLYTWEQTKDDVKVVLKLEGGVTRDQLEVEVKERELAIQCQQRTVLSGALRNAVDTELTTWTLQADRLEVTLSKRETGLVWAELIPEDDRGEQIVNPALAAEVQARLGHLCSDTEVKDAGEGMAPTFNLDQLEECDCLPDEARTLVRLDNTSHTISHQVSLAGHQWMMGVVEDPALVPSVCVRHDVDGCLWRLSPPTNDWACEHVGSFSALGYVAASKQQRKFMLAAPDLSYAVICEATSHVFVYRKASIVNGELRNRRTSAKVATVAKQQLINLESSAPILGAQATNSHLFILTRDTLYMYHIQ